jgi:5'-phosphate synthase pdxT subunit
MNIGVLALQGGYQAHVNCLNKLNCIATRVRDPATLSTTDALIIPGGESSVLIKLLKENGLWACLIDYDKPMLATCAGAILLAREVLSPVQASLNRMSITVKRNAYGRQLASQIVMGDNLITAQAMEMVFIRAPEITLLEENTSIKVLARYRDRVVAVQENNLSAASFHPELSQDSYLHRYFIQQIVEQESVL